MLALVLGIAGCGETPTGVGFEVIEEVEFGASLNIDLATMTRLGTGVYIKDVVVGAGDEVVFGTGIGDTSTYCFL